MSSDESGAHMTDALRNTTWTLVGSPLAAEGVEVVMAFGDGTVSGFSGCNRFSGSYRLTVDTLEFGPLATTRMACPPDAMRMEDDVLGRLAQVVTAAIEPAELHLFDAQGALLLRFGTQLSDGLGGDWLVTSIHYPERQAIISTRGMVNVTFGPNQVSGHGGCNRFHGPVTVVETAMSIGPLVATGEFCESDADAGPTIMEQEQALIRALEASVGYRIEGRKLTLWRGDGGIALTLTRD